MNSRHPQKKKATRTATTSVNEERDEMIVNALEEVFTSQIDSSSHDTIDSWSVDPTERVAYFKRKLQEAKEKHQVKCREMRTEVETLRRALADSKESYVSEIMALQNKVCCLNDKLRFAKASSTSSSGEGNRCRERHVGAIDQNERIGRSLPMGSSDIKKEEGDTRDFIQTDIVKAPGSPSLPRPMTTNNHHHRGNDDDKKQGTSIIVLRKINESLVKELENTKKTCEEYRISMIHETERSAKELQAFGEALKSKLKRVDDLRQVTEEMSQEIARLKGRGSENKRINKGVVDSMSIGSQIEKIHVPLPRERIAWCKVTKHFKRLEPLQMSR